MKRIFGLLGTLAVLFTAASCQQEVLPAEGDMGDRVTAKLTVSIPDAMQTKAFGDASGIQAAGVDYEIYEYDETSKTYNTLVLKDNLKLDENLKGTLELKLIRFRTYGVFFWASTSDLHTPDQALGLQKMKIDYTPNVENDAFAGRVLNIAAETDLELPDVVLKRPFAQLNFATDDLGADKNVTAGDLALQNITVTVPGLATYFDNATGLGTDPAQTTAFVSDKVLTDPFVMNEVNYDHILMFYALPAGETMTANLDTKITVTRGTETTPVTVDWTGKSAMNNVPVSQNYRTNFYGSFLTADGTINVSVDQKFEETSNVNVNTLKATAEEILAATAEDGTYHVSGTITAVNAVAGDASKETVTIDDKLTVTLAVPASKADASEEGTAATYYAVGSDITVEVVKKDGVVAESAVLVAYTPAKDENPDEGGEGEGEVDVPSEPTFKAGNYWIMDVNKTHVVYPITSGTYGYWNHEDAINGASYATNVFTFTAVEGGFTINDANGVYYYGSTYNSFSISTTCPSDGTEVWTVEVTDNGYKITNVSNTFTVSYSTYGNYAPYPEGSNKSTGELPILVEATEDLIVPEPEGGNEGEGGEAVDGQYTWTLGSGNQTWAADTHATYGDGFSATVDGVKVGYYKHGSSSDARTPDADHIRVYKGSALVISAEGKKVKKVVITPTEKKYVVDINVNGSTVSPEGTTITWEGDTDSFEAIMETAQVRIKTLTIVAE